MNKTKVLKMNYSVHAETNKRPIELIKHVGYSGEIEDTKFKPCQYDNVCLLSSPVRHNELNPYDIIMAWDNHWAENERAVFLGHWNDGIVDA